MEKPLQLALHAPSHADYAGGSTVAARAISRALSSRRAAVAGRRVPLAALRARRHPGVPEHLPFAGVGRRISRLLWLRLLAHVRAAADAHRRRLGRRSRARLRTADLHRRGRLVRELGHRAGLLARPPRLAGPVRRQAGARRGARRRSASIRVAPLLPLLRRSRSGARRCRRRDGRGDVAA